MDIYNINKYSDNELYRILEISGAVSDHELETKILFNIDKYKDNKTKDGKAIHRFFMDVYDHFFETEADETADSINIFNNISNTIVNPILKFLSNSEGFEDRQLSTDNLIAGSLPGGGSINLTGGITDLGANINSNALGPQSVYTLPPTKGQTNQDLSFNIGIQDQNTIGNKQELVSEKSGNTNYTSTLTYTQGKLNPILKETIRRIISIDSQYRDIPVYPSTTNFSFNLSDTLVDVVSLKLYSIQIPYTWYTINGNFGSNFFYIKGNSPGIGDNDAATQYKIIVPSGNYTQNSIITQVSLSIANLKSVSNDISFGTSDISYNSSTVRSILTMDITQIYDESYYELEFLNATSPQDPSYNLLSIPSILGFNNSIYSPTTLYSKTFKSTTTAISYPQYYDISADNPSKTIGTQLATQYTFTNAPYFNVFLYTSNTNTNTQFADISFIPISVISPPLTTYINTSTINCITIMSTLSTGISHSGTEIMNDFNTQILNAGPNSNSCYFTSDSCIKPVYVNNSTQKSSSIERFSMNIKLNRAYANLNNPNLKTAIQFPDESYDSINNPIFSDSSGNHSLFQFPSPIIDMSFVTLNNFTTESPALLMTYDIVDSVKCPYFLAQCQLSGYNNNFNDYIFQFPGTPQSDLSYNTYISRFNDNSANKLYYYSQSNISGAYSNIILPNTDIVDVCFNSINTNANNINPEINNISFNINRRFFNNDYSLNISNTELTKYFGYVNDISFTGFQSTKYSYCLNSDLTYIPTAEYPSLSISGISNTSVNISYFGANNITTQTTCSFTSTLLYENINVLLDYLSSTINHTMDLLYYNPNINTSDTTIANTSRIYLDCSYNNTIYTDTSYNNNNTNMYRFRLQYTLPNFQIDMTNSVLFDDYRISAMPIGPTTNNISNITTIIRNLPFIPTNLTTDKWNITGINIRAPISLQQFDLTTSHTSSVSSYIENVNLGFQNTNGYLINNAGSILLQPQSSPYPSYNIFDLSFNIITNISTQNYNVSLYSSSRSAITGTIISATISAATGITWDSSNNIWYNYFNIPLLSSSIHFTSTTNSISCNFRNNTIYINNANRYFMIKPNPIYSGVFTSTINPNPNPDPNVIANYKYNDVLYDLLPQGYSEYKYYTIDSFIAALNTAVVTETSIETNTPSINIKFDMYKTSSYANSNGLIRQYTQCSVSINKKYTTGDYRLVFYDPYSFVFCNSGLSTNSAQNTAWDATLGWLLGFRSLTEYYLTQQNMGFQYPGLTPATYYIDVTTGTLYTTTEYFYDSSSNVVKIIGDTSVNVSLYNYFMIILDDYCQNHLNDGLVTIISSASDIALPSYANRSTMICAPNGSSSNIINSAGLTQNQIYSATQIYNQQQSKIKSYSSGPFVQDVFALIPIKTAGLASGSTYIEFGGSLQLQDRTYFGPVNIKKLTVKLIDDKGSIVNLNNANWSFSLVCEQLYNPNPQK